MTEPQSLFSFEDELFVPTVAALGPWRPDALHGSAINALFARSFERADFLIARMTIDILRRVPPQPLQLKLSEESGSRRLRWQNAVLSAAGTVVAKAQCLRIPLQDIDLPEQAVKPQTLHYEAEQFPVRISEKRKAGIIKNIGYPSFVSHGMNMVFAEGSYMKPGPATAWLKLMLPVVAEEPITPYQRLAAAADYSGAANAVLPFHQWTFMNSDLTLSITRLPIGEWMAVSSEVHSQRSGVGLGDALLHDRSGPIGRSTQTQLISRRKDSAPAKTGT